MSGYARAAHVLGATVSGSDGAPTRHTWSVCARMACWRRASATTPPTCPPARTWRLSIRAPCRAENPEREAARERGLSERPRAELLGELSALQRTIAVAGTHGKTTTASMLVHVLRAAGAAPVGWWALPWAAACPTRTGARVNGWWSRPTSPTARCSRSRGDRRADQCRAGPPRELRLAGAAARGLPRVSRARAQSRCGVGSPRAGRAGTGGSVRGGLRVGEGVREATRASPTTSRPRRSPGGSRFDWRDREVSLAVPGAHNALNAAAALEAASLAGADPEHAIEGLAGFTGAGRRFQRLGEPRAGGGVRRLRPPPHRAGGHPACGAHAGARAAGGGVPAPPLLTHRAARAGVRRGAGARRRGGGARRLSRARARGGFSGGERPDCSRRLPRTPREGAR